MKRNWRHLLSLLFFLNVQTVHAEEKVLVFAASSLTNALTELAEQFETQTGDQVVLSFASSSALARQLAQGAPADVYLSANTKWMDYVVAQQVVNTDTRQDLLHNRLVLIGHASSAIEPIALDNNWNIAAMLNGSRIAVGDPNHVPAGMYAKQALTSLGLWQQAEPRLARANNVRAALLYVERQEAALGIVYQTDALIAANVRVLAQFPQESHDPITYPMVLTQKQPTAAAQAFYRFLESDQAADVFKKYGFSVD
ncbi:molybdate ABC transporter substrate-binding protein [Photobacterium sp. 1_MG-2023]|uniref:molybdate ABC transporter substrate-binding protein n=1 Tax=Photobacterium sp. 1_MG-2023 TaxID=3062646 RepID=UPI0026E37295|nr:molybdate ABC transporter substrate-binding protein [Photobacterium sp. 1_MG-2023]MDO6706742.1 molybdate ABC transporter substrate-binding protein [Photobacterium sp. 1_MG-2023]